MVLQILDIFHVKVCVATLVKYFEYLFNTFGFILALPILDVMNMSIVYCRLMCRAVQLLFV